MDKGAHPTDIRCVQDHPTIFARTMLLGRDARAWTLAIAVLVAHLPPAQAADTCSGRAYLTDPDPKGTNVRAEPRADAPIIGRLPPLLKLTDVDTVGVEFEMSDTRNGWLLIRNAERDDPNGRSRTFAIAGWVWGGLISMTAGDGRLRSGLSEEAPVLAWLMDRDKGWGPDSFEIKIVHACAGLFAEVTVAPPSGKRMRGWIGHFCSSQLTTCDYAYPEGVQIPPDARYPQ